MTKKIYVIHQDVLLVIFCKIVFLIEYIVIVVIDPNCTSVHHKKNINMFMKIIFYYYIIEMKDKKFRNKKNRKWMLFSIIAVFENNS